MTGNPQDEERLARRSGPRPLDGPVELGDLVRVPLQPWVVPDVHTGPRGWPFHERLRGPVDVASVEGVVFQLDMDPEPEDELFVVTAGPRDENDDPFPWIYGAVGFHHWVQDVFHVDPQDGTDAHVQVVEQAGFVVGRVIPTMGIRFGPVMAWWEGVRGEAMTRRCRVQVRAHAGTRVAFRQDVDRYPHFRVPAGTTGTISLHDHDILAVRLDRPPEGAREWGGEVHWYRSEPEDWRWAWNQLDHDLTAARNPQDEERLARRQPAGPGLAALGRGDVVHAPAGLPEPMAGTDLWRGRMLQAAGRGVVMDVVDDQRRDPVVYVTDHPAGPDQGDPFPWRYSADEFRWFASDTLAMDDVAPGGGRTLEDVRRAVADRGYQCTLARRALCIRWGKGWAAWVDQDADAVARLLTVVQKTGTGTRVRVGGGDAPGSSRSVPSGSTGTVAGVDRTWTNVQVDGGGLVRWPSSTAWQVLTPLPPASSNPQDEERLARRAGVPTGLPLHVRLASGEVVDAGRRVVIRNAKDAGVWPHGEVRPSVGQARLQVNVTGPALSGQPREGWVFVEFDPQRVMGVTEDGARGLLAFVAENGALVGPYDRVRGNEPIVLEIVGATPGSRNPQDEERLARRVLAHGATDPDVAAMEQALDAGDQSLARRHLMRIIETWPVQRLATSALAVTLDGPAFSRSLDLLAQLGCGWASDGAVGYGGTWWDAGSTDRERAAPGAYVRHFDQLSGTLLGAWVVVPEPGCGPDVLARLDRLAQQYPVTRPVADVLRGGETFHPGCLREATQDVGSAWRGRPVERMLGRWPRGARCPWCRGATRRPRPNPQDEERVSRRPAIQSRLSRQLDDALIEFDGRWVHAWLPRGTLAANVRPAGGHGFHFESSDDEGVTWRSSFTDRPLPDFLARPNPQDEERLARRHARTDWARALEDAERQDTWGAWTAFVAAHGLPEADQGEVEEALRRVRQPGLADVPAMRWLLLRQAMAEAGWGGGPELPDPPSDPSVLAAQVAMRRAVDHWIEWIHEDAFCHYDGDLSAMARAARCLESAMLAMGQPAMGNGHVRREALMWTRTALRMLEGEGSTENPQDEERLAGRAGGPATLRISEKSTGAVARRVGHASVSLQGLVGFDADGRAVTPAGQDWSVAADDPAHEVVLTSEDGTVLFSSDEILVDGLRGRMGGHGVVCMPAASRTSLATGPRYVSYFEDKGPVVWLLDEAAGAWVGRPPGIRGVLSGQTHPSISDSRLVPGHRVKLVARPRRGRS